MKKDIYLQLFANCIPVKGASKSIICDLQNHSYLSIPNDMFDVIFQLQDMSLISVKTQYAEDDQQTIQEYLDFLIDNGLAFETTSPERFPSLNTSFEDPSIISNALIDLDETSTWDLENLISQLEEVLCKHIQVRFFKNTRFQEIVDLLDLVKSRNSLITSIELLVPFDLEIQQHLSALFSKFSRLFGISLYAAPKDTKEMLDSNGRFVCYTKQVVHGSGHCGFISPDYFVVNTSLFTESIHHNNCLHKKVGIDVHGNIKNCPAMQKIYGHLSKDSIKAVALTKIFRSVGEINKDQIKVCQDCEFRYICTDCRAFIDQGEIENAKPIKCNYNPYEGNWN